MVNEGVRYIFLGRILNKYSEFGEMIKENDTIVAVPSERFGDTCKILKKFEDFVVFDEMVYDTFRSVSKSEATRIKDLRLMRRDYNRREVQRKMSDLVRQCDINTFENKFPTIILKIPTSICEDPLPVLW